MNNSKTVVQVIDNIRSFTPDNGNWLRLEDLLAELWATGAAGDCMPDLLGVLERYPEDESGGVLWSVVHGVESLPGYEGELIQSVQRGPSELGITMIGRLLKAGTSDVEGVTLIDLLHNVAESTAPECLRVHAARLAQRYAAR